MLLTAGIRDPFGKAGLRPSEYAEVRSERTRVTDLVWRGDGPESAAAHRYEGCCARVVGQAGTSFASSTEPDLTAVIRQARSAVGGKAAAASLLAPGEPFRGEFRCPVTEPGDQVSLAEKVLVLGGYHAAARAAHQRVTGALLYYRECTSEVEVATSDGASARYERRDITLQITVYAGTGATRAAGSLSAGCGGDFADVRGLAERVEHAAATGVDLADAPAAEAGSYDVVCDGALAGIWAHETIGHLAEADHQIGDIELTEALRPGRRIGPPGLTITDGPGLPGARGYVPVDDEGVLGREITLIRDGVLAQPRVHDRATAAIFGEPVTGSGRALSFRHPPLPRLRTLAVAPGTSSEDELVAGVRHGILARGVLGGQTDRLGFTFLPAECRLIRDGQVAGLVRSVVLSGNVLDAFASIDGIGGVQWRGDTSASCGKQGQYPLPVSCWAPPLRLRGTDVRAG